MTKWLKDDLPRKRWQVMLSAFLDIVGMQLIRADFRDLKRRVEKLEQPQPKDPFDEWLGREARKWR